MTVVPHPLTLPTHRENLFDPPHELAGVPPISPLRLAGGVTGWLVTGHALAKELLSGDAMSSELRNVTMADPRLDEQFKQVVSAPGDFVNTDPPEHTRYRKLLTGQFTVRRMKVLEPRIRELVDTRLDALAAAGPGSDLVREFAIPVSSTAICELLGVPEADRGEFQDVAQAILHFDTDPQEVAAGHGKLREFVGRLVAAKRAAPGDDLVSGLIANSELADAELVTIANLLLIAGHETTANMFGLGTFALLRHRDQWEALRNDPGLMPQAVEELMRYLTIVGGSSGLPRVAKVDLRLGGAHIRAGQTVLVALPTVNRDPALAENPGSFDVTRPRTHHLAFGYGIHQCLGQQLARVELQIGFTRLVERFPDLRLAVPDEQVPLRTDMLIYGVHALPVTW
ncbi:cytochrome P450 [Amycolatopsis sp. NBC_01480]|jgi:cytochrome P450|uniref:cytochrome P450 n=1 Tax=Amycolatopsis sp. NBC_01480 TaxID=2903562 RepID=UPI002E2CC2F1|nr:cytochrome P450 [Amycolatopsis sp. NBC_01480]